MFVEEMSIGIVSLRVNNSENVQVGKRTTLHWCDGKRYPVLFVYHVFCSQVVLTLVCTRV